MLKKFLCLLIFTFTLGLSACGDDSGGAGPQSKGWDSGEAGAPPIASVVYIDKSIDFDQTGEVSTAEDDQGRSFFLSSFWDKDPLDFSNQDAINFIQDVCDDGVRSVSIRRRDGYIVVEWGSTYRAEIELQEIDESLRYDVFCYVD